ncbi:helix-turn-helix domain-containing protein [Leptobacterium flavescens]|uniref:Helix-turn-helix domain-containing protein n=1 Tax=Leptobacterium flavescens TaxID=472055 RepID=A0A6P0URC8_9FLAO|nr:helix-turn-helix domain-containing protein [Leptobacterium flavescens]NER15080.1 helix-turn-helix domain-containing protein [Leptobacterium flavescens]
MKHLISFVLIVGVVLCGFIIFSLIRTKKNELPQRILISFWVFILAVFLHFYGNLNELKLLSSLNYPFINISQMFLPVLVFLYVKSIFFYERSFFRKNIWHFIPTIIYFVFFTLPNLINLFTDPDVFNYVKRANLTMITLFKDSYGVLYFILSLALLHKVQKKLKHLYSHLGQRHFLWLNIFLFTFFGVIVIDFIFTLSEFLFNYRVEWDGYITVILLIVSMFYLAYYGIRQITLFIPEFLTQDKEQLSGASEDFNKLNEKLRSLLETDKPYLIPNLTLSDLAEKLGTSEKTLSHFLNNFLNVSFYDLINKHRVNEARENLRSKELEKYSIIGIGSLCGFSSKSSFYRVFKKETGLTPLSYKKQFDK